MPGCQEGGLLGWKGEGQTRDSLCDLGTNSFLSLGLHGPTNKVRMDLTLPETPSNMQQL